jgi:hypothetical protein
MSQEINSKILRKLGAAEVVYDYELKLKGCVLPFTMILSSEIDLFAQKSLIDDSLRKWKELHPFLNAKIVNLDSENPNDENRFSQERYFALMDPELSNNLENISYLRLESNSNKELSNQKIINLLHERELNIKPVNSKTGPLWRLGIYELERAKQYTLILNIHHAIVDGRNALAIMEQLVNLIDKAINNDQSSIRYESYEISSSIEEKLFNNDEKLIKDVKPAYSEFEPSPDSKIPAFLAPNKESPHNNLVYEVKFTYLFEKANRNQPLVLSRKDKDSEWFSAFTTFSFDKVDKLTSKCRKFGAKLTGCLNLVSALATMHLYKSHSEKIDSSLYEKVNYHYLVNLRPFLGLDNLKMGYWPVVQNGKLSTENKKLDLGNDQWYRREFWDLVKYESDLIHTRLSNEEHIESAKLDAQLLDLINDKNFKFEQGGSVHFALSNLGPFKPVETKSLHIKEFYYNTSTAPNRWSAVMFHGLSTVENTLCWSFGYNSKLIDEKYAKFLCDSILMILEKAIQD